MTVPYADLQNLHQTTGFVELYTLDCTNLGGSVYRFTNTPASSGSVTFGSDVYQVLPIQSSDWEFSSTANTPKPKLTVSNVNKTLLSAVVSLGDLVGATVTRIRTFAKYLDDGTARYNMLNYSEDITQWDLSTGGTGVLPVVTANAALSPIGTMTADRVVFNKGAGTTTTDQSTISAVGVTTVVGQPYTISFWARSATSSSYLMQINFNGFNGTNSIITVTPEWNRFTTTITSASDTSSRMTLQLRGAQGTDNYADIYLWGAQQENSLTASEYQYTTTTHQPFLDSTKFIGPDVYIVEQKVAHNKEYISWQLTSPLDRFGIKLPRRQILKDKGFPGVSRTRLA